MFLKTQLKWLKRDISYIFWMVAEATATTAIPRLLIFPLAAYFVGKEQFGVFMTAISLAMILGSQPAEGLSTGLIKHLSDYSRSQWAQFCGTALRLCRVAMNAIIPLVLLIIVTVGITKLAPWEILNCLIPLIISLYSENLFTLTLTENRVHRRFRERTGWFMLQSAGILIFGLAGAWADGATGLAWGYMAGNTLAYVILRFRYGNCYKTAYNPGMASILKAIWFQMTIAGVMSLSGPYLNRVILSAIHSYNDTADLVAATSVTYLFSVPITCLGGLLLSMISGYSSVKQFSTRGRIQYSLLILFSITMMPLAFKLFGPFLVRLMFPKFGESAVGLFGILIWAIPAQNLISLTRPFVIKFAPIQLLPIINAVSVAATLIPAILLIPHYATRGAAQAVAIGSAVVGILWVSSATWVFFVKPLSRTQEI